MRSAIKTALLIVLAVSLLLIQIGLIRNNVLIAESEFNNLMSLKMSNITEGLRQSYYCYTTQTSLVVPKDKDFFLMAPEYPGEMPRDTNTTALDTVEAGSFIDSFRFKRYNFGTPTKVNLRLDFEFIPLETEETYSGLNGDEKYTYHLYKNSLISDEGDRIVDTLLVDSLVSQHLRSVQGAENCAYRLYLNNQVIYESHEVDGYKLFSSKQKLYGPGPFPPVWIEVYLKNPLWNLLWSKLYFFIAVIGLTALIIILFVRNLKSLKSLERLNNLKEEFIHIMTHEFNTPVTNIAMAVEQFDATLPKSKLDRLLQIIGIETNRIKGNINTLFEINKLSVNDIKLHLEEHSIHEMITTVISLFEVSFSKHEIEVTTNLSAARDRILCDRIHILNVFTNLIENCVKYRGTNPRIDISTSNTPHEVLIAITDNGIGMSKEQVQMVFQKYYRSKDLNVQSIEGMGLGLYYCKKIVEFHQGTIEIDSALNQGTTITVRLPFKQ